MSKMIIPEDYKPHLNLIETEVAIKMIKDTFERRLAEQLRLTRVSAPLFLLKNTGLNDNLNGIEKPVSFTSFELNHDDEIEIIHSLAKWKRHTLARFGFNEGEGLVVNMKALRPDEDSLDATHSVYVDQWDWEKIIAKEDRKEETLKEIVSGIYEVFKKIVSKIYNALLDVEFLMIRHYPQLGESILPDEIFFITSQELEDKYPDLTPKQRERMITKEHKAVCILQIGDILKSGHKHDGRAPDYDDW